MRDRTHCKTKEKQKRRDITACTNACQGPDVHDRRKFRSQTSDNMDRWKSRGGKSQRRERKKKEDQRREREKRKEEERRSEKRKEAEEKESEGWIAC